MKQTVKTDLTPEQMTEARGWIADCFPEIVDELTDDEIIEGINKYYIGGIDFFLLAIQLH